MPLYTLAKRKKKKKFGPIFLENQTERKKKVERTEEYNGNVSGFNLRGKLCSWWKLIESMDS